MPTDPKRLRDQADRLRLLADEQENGFLADLMREVARGVAELVPEPSETHAWSEHSIYLTFGEAKDGGAVLTWRSDLVNGALHMKETLKAAAKMWAATDPEVGALQAANGYDWNVGDVVENGFGDPTFDRLLAEAGVELVCLETLQASQEWGHDDIILRRKHRGD